MDKQNWFIDNTSELLIQLNLEFEKLMEDVCQVFRRIDFLAQKSIEICVDCYSKFKEFRIAITHMTKVNLIKAKDFVEKFYKSFGEFCKTGNAIFTFIRMVIDIIDIFIHKEHEEPSLVLF